MTDQLREKLAAIYGGYSMYLSFVELLGEPIARWLAKEPHLKTPPNQ